MSSLEKDYYTIEESIHIIKKAEIDITESDIFYYGECGQLNFNLYVGSRPAYACRYKTAEEFYLIGHCKLHGIFPLPRGELCAIIANDKHIIEFLQGHPAASHLELSNWATDIPKEALQAKSGYEKIWAPEPYSFDLKHTINFYYLRPKLVLQLKDVLPGALIPFGFFPDNILSNALEFELGTVKQFPESQTFKKSDLRITNSNIQQFIAMLKKPTGNVAIPAVEPIPSCPTPPQQIKKDKRSTERAQALTVLAKSVWANGEGKEFTAFKRMLMEHSPNTPYEGYGDCTKIYLEDSQMHFTLITENGASIKDSVAIDSMKHHFTKAKEK